MGREKQGRSMNSGSKTFQKQIKPSVLLLGSVYVAASQMLAQQNIISNITTVSKRMHIPMIKSNASPSGFGSRHSSTYQQHSLSVADGVCGKQTGQSSYAGNFQAPRVCFARICVHLQTMKTSSPKALMLSPATSWQPSLTRVGGNARQAAKSHGCLKKTIKVAVQIIHPYTWQQHMVGICSSHMLHISQVPFNFKETTTKNTPEHPDVFKKSKIVSRFTV